MAERHAACGGACDSMDALRPRGLPFHDVALILAGRPHRPRIVSAQQRARHRVRDGSGGRRLARTSACDSEATGNPSGLFYPDLLLHDLKLVLARRL